MVSVPAVDLERAAFLPHDGDELVHDPARHPRELVLGRLARQRLGARRRRSRRRQRREERERRDFHGRGAGQTAA